MRKLAIVGVGGLGRELHELVEDINRENPEFEFIGFLDENVSLHGKYVHGAPVLGDLSWLEKRRDVAVGLGIGNPAIKSGVVSRLREVGADMPVLRHPRSVVGQSVDVGEGVIICAGAIVTADISIGSYSTININATVGHDSTLSDFVTLAPGVHVSGNVTINQGVDVGTGATIVPSVTIGEWSIIGAGASIVKDVPANVTSVGVPARVIKQREPGWQSLRLASV